MSARIGRAQLNKMFSAVRVDLRKEYAGPPSFDSNMWVNTAHQAARLHRHLIDKTVTGFGLGSVYDIRKEPFHKQRLVADLSVSALATNLLLTAFYFLEKTNKPATLEWHAANFFAFNSLNGPLGNFLWDRDLFGDEGIFKIQAKLRDRWMFRDAAVPGYAIFSRMVEGKESMPFFPKLETPLIGAALEQMQENIAGLVEMKALGSLIGEGKTEDASGRDGKVKWLVSEAVSDYYALGLIGWAAFFAGEAGQDKQLMDAMASYFSMKTMPKHISGPGRTSWEIQEAMRLGEGKDLPEVIIAEAEFRGR